MNNEITSKAKENQQVDKSIISEIESLRNKLNQQLSNENIEELLTLKKLLEDKVNELRSLLAKTNS